MSVLQWIEHAQQCDIRPSVCRLNIQQAIVFLRTEAKKMCRWEDAPKYELLALTLECGQAVFTNNRLSLGHVYGFAIECVP